MEVGKMKINLEHLIGAVQEHFDNDRSYRLEGKKKDWWKRTQEEIDRVTWHERNLHGSSNEVYDLCAILNIDINKLYIIARLARKWEEKHNYEKCFPVDAISDKIMEYLESDKASQYWDKNWLNIKINNKVKKAA
jgi:hypothetical protein